MLRIIILFTFLISYNLANAFSLFGMFSDKPQVQTKSITPSLVVPATNHIENTPNIRVSRYVTQKEYIPLNHVDLLSQNISIRFSPSVLTVADAIKQLLQNSGLVLIDSQYQDRYTKQMLKNKLPTTQRTIENATLKQALEALTGNNFNVVLDPITRQINFKIKSKVLAIYLNLGN
ncbi:hypothetical protein [Francisella sp. SYW-9]|uniref:hypothetical protein n=1 Tax=Francisella sp. SYW-9 TaxID=2610888 RepID=UPI00123D64EE|nr:hypothetical protein [Francisella sp. SYW-9]